MSDVKEKIFNAVAVMDDYEAEKVWRMIMPVPAVPSFDEIEPFPDEVAAFAAARSGDPEYRPSFSQREVLQILGI